jgi:hypothetical protein
LATPTLSSAETCPAAIAVKNQTHHKSRYRFLKTPLIIPPFLFEGSSEYTPNLFFTISIYFFFRTLPPSLHTGRNSAMKALVNRSHSQTPPLKNELKCETLLEKRLAALRPDR